MRKAVWIAVIIGVVGACGFGLKARAAAAADTVQAGTTAPNFTLPSQEDKPVSLTEYKGKWVVLYFYPKDQTRAAPSRPTTSSATWQSTTP